MNMKIETGRQKSIKFGVSVSGIQARDLTGWLLLTVESISYQIPFTYRDNYIQVVIPPLNSFITSELKLGQQIPITLNVKTGNEIQVPYAGSLTIIRETVSVEITSVKSQSVITDENRFREIIKNISESEYSTGIKRKKEIEVKDKSTFFKTLWNDNK